MGALWNKKTKEQIAAEAAAQAKVCSRCGELKAFACYGKHPGKVHGLQANCKPCLARCVRDRRAKSLEKERKRERELRRKYEAQRVAADPLYYKRRGLAKYGLTLEGRDALFAAQGFKCAICQTEKSHRRNAVWHVDHDHKTGKVRGVLCSHCNRMLGAARDKPETLSKAIEYLARQSTTHQEVEACAA